MATTVPPSPKQPIRLASGSTIAEFTWHRDRWRHDVTTTVGHWVSLEGGDDDRADARWPASPALVELSLIALADGPAVLGVGLAGRSHFSLSVRPCPRTADTILFDAACRIHEPAAWLGSTYRGSEGLAVRIEAATAAAPATVTWGYSIGPAGVRATTPPLPAARA